MRGSTRALLLLVAAGVLATAPAQRYEPGMCGDVNDCDQAWAIEAAYECQGGRCACHPNATFNKDTLQCDCDSGFVKSRRKCIPLTRVGETCTHDVDCSSQLGGYSVCEYGRCICNNASVTVNNTCQQKIGLDGRCTYNEQCYIENSVCFNGICLCKTPNYVANTNSCVPIVNDYNGTCVNSPQCQKGSLGEGSFCIYNKCVCETQYFYNRTVGRGCLFKKALEEPCDNIQLGCYLDADGYNQNIECKNKMCQCVKRYKPSEDRKRCVGGAAQAYLSSLSVVLLFVAYIAK